MKSRNPWKKLNSKIVYKNKWIKVREDKVVRPNGERGIYGVVETNDSVFIVPLTKKNEIYLIQEYRYPTQQFSWEIPAGSSDGKNLLAAAKRELKEETGLVAKKWIKIGTMQPFNAVATEIGHIYLAQQLTQTGYHEQKEEGIVAMKKVTFQKVFKMIKDNEIIDSPTITSIFKTVQKLNIK